MQDKTTVEIAMLFVFFIFIKELRADWNQAMLAIIQCRIFVVQFVIQKYKD